MIEIRKVRTRRNCDDCGKVKEVFYILLLKTKSLITKEPETIELARLCETCYKEFLKEVKRSKKLKLKRKISAKDLSEIEIEDF
jgi:CRISPR/Cas system-associated endonuclease Cas3-HD